MVTMWFHLHLVKNDKRKLTLEKTILAKNNKYTFKDLSSFKLGVLRTHTKLMIIVKLQQGQIYHACCFIYYNCHDAIRSDKFVLLHSVHNFMLFYIDVMLLKKTFLGIYFL